MGEAKDRKEKDRKLTEYIPEFESKIQEISVFDVESNQYNPRKKFGQEEEDELIDSIAEKGVLQPIIVYEKKSQKGKYVLLDGERRFKACKKLGIEKIPAHILVKEPKLLDNISLMFHIHNVHEAWTDIAIAKTIETILNELGINKKKPTPDEIKHIQKITSLSAYKINKFLTVLNYSKPVITKFLSQN